MKLILIDKDNNLLLDYDKSEEDILVNDSIDIRSNDNGLIIKLLRDYKIDGGVKISVDEDGDIKYITENSQD